MKCESPWPEVILYVCGMVFVIFGICGMIASTSSHPFMNSARNTFLPATICSLVIGCILLALIATMPAIPGKNLVKTDRIAFTSAFELLEDVQSVDCSDEPIVKLQNASAYSSEESVRIVQSCMMMQNPLTASQSILFYRETIVWAWEIILNRWITYILLLLESDFPWKQKKYLCIWKNIFAFRSYTVLT